MSLIREICGRYVFVIAHGTGGRAETKMSKIQDTWCLSLVMGRVGENRNELNMWCLSFSWDGWAETKTKMEPKGSRQMMVASDNRCGD